MIDRSSYEPLYIQIRKDIEEKILSGEIKVGDKLIVNTKQGEAEVEVIRVHEKDATETALPIGKYKSVLRKA